MDYPSILTWALIAVAFIGPAALIWFAPIRKFTVPLGTAIFSGAGFAFWTCFIYLLDPGEGEPTVAEYVQTTLFLVLAGAVYSISLALLRMLVLSL